MSTLILAMTLAAPALKDPPKKELNIVGEWVVESQITNGREMKTAPGRKYNFTADGKYTQTTAKAKVPSKISRAYAIDTKTNPAAIDMKTSTALEQPNMIGIVRVDGDTLTICYVSTDRDRPKTFDAADGSGATMLIMIRMKKD